jgi:hypothetical protein
MRDRLQILLKALSFRTDLESLAAMHANASTVTPFPEIIGKLRYERGTRGHNFSYT